MYAAVKIYKDSKNNYPPSVAPNGFYFMSESIDACRQYVRSHRNDFREYAGVAYPAIVRFEPTEIPLTVHYFELSPMLHSCPVQEGRLLARKIVEMC